MTEIGSEFYYTDEAEPIFGCSVGGLLDHCGALYLDSGRSAIQHFYRAFVSPRRMLMPAYCCHSMLQGLPPDKIGFYDINEDLGLDTDSLFSKLGDDVGALLFVNYFGFLQPPHVMRALEKVKHAGVLILEDTTHSIFTSFRTAGGYCVCSLRKWFALPDGGAFYPTGGPAGYPENEALFTLRDRAMRLKSGYIKNGGEKKPYQTLFMQGETLLDTQSEPRAMTRASCALLARQGTEIIRGRRRRNFLCLQRSLPRSVTPVKRLDDDRTVPMFFPVYCERRGELAGILREQGIYCPVHWPAFAHSGLAECTGARRIRENILSLPIDQRYDESDMARMASAIADAGV